ncbi:chitinase 3 [Coccidioides immitis H538.4]|uniref:Chitinase 3 n=1 Tax=Coccidioides immitis H538.4 TaxID=396776 RepID=A0A0J8RYB1_COCIT|nr:chitinase 3 [Coccidioides immitis H538.4]
MKATALLSIALCAAFGAAQNLDDISECGRMCINNMLNKASELGCDSTDKACLCSKQNFAFGLRDCTLQACGAEDLPKIIAVGQAICASEGGSMTASGTASDTATGTPTGTPTGTDGPDSTPSETASSTPTVSDSNGTASPTSGLTGTPTSGSVAETTTESPTETEIPPGQTTPAEGAAGRVMTTAAPGVAGALGLIALLAM